MIVSTAIETVEWSDEVVEAVFGTEKRRNKMKVCDLIKLLQTMNPNDIVKIPEPEGGCFTHWIDVDYVDKSNNKVYINPAD